MALKALRRDGDLPSLLHPPHLRYLYGTSLKWELVRGTKIGWATVLAVTAAQFAIAHLPPLRRLLATEPVPLWDGVLVVAVGAVLLVLVETEKQIRIYARELRSPRPDLGAPTGGTGSGLLPER